MKLRWLVLILLVFALPGCGSEGYQQRKGEVDPETVNVPAPGGMGEEQAPSEPQP